jgi:hypothetical protein
MRLELIMLTTNSPAWSGPWCDRTGPCHVTTLFGRVAISSYPFFDPEHEANTNVVLRDRDAQKLVQVKRAVEEMLERVRRDVP